MALQDMFTSQGGNTGGIYDWSNLNFNQDYFTQLDSYNSALNGVIPGEQGELSRDLGGGPNLLDFITTGDGQSINSLAGGKGGAWYDPNTNSFRIQRRTHAPGTEESGNDTYKYHYSDSLFQLGEDGSTLKQMTPWNDKTLSSSWKKSGPTALAMIAAVLSAGAAGGAFGAAGAGGGAGAGSAATASEIAAAEALGVGLPTEVGGWSLGAGQAAGAAGAGGGLESILGSTPMSTPAPGISSVSESLMQAGVPMSTPAPGMGITAEMATGAGGLAGSAIDAGATEAAQGLSSADKGALYSDSGYGAAMSGAETGLFDSLLSFTGSPGIANAVTNVSAPIMNNPYWDEFQKFFKSPGGRGLRTLGSLYNYKKNQSGIKNQIGQLSQLFGPNSAYAQQLRQQLERRDAAAGRRSQYGPREVELQAKLAQSAAAQAPTLMQLHDRSNALRNQGINTLLNQTNLEKLFGG